jgi:uncharacterized DUF497 family protein
VTLEEGVIDEYPITKKLVISEKIAEKLRVKHKVSKAEIAQCFQDNDNAFLTDDREEHASVPQTKWFVAETDKGRILKVCFVPYNGLFYIRTAYEANETEIKIFEDNI